MTDTSMDPVVFSDAVTFTWPGHVFPTGKYKALADRLLYEQVVAGFATPDRATREELLTCHTESYLEQVTSMPQEETSGQEDETEDNLERAFPEEACVLQAGPREAEGSPESDGRGE